MKQGSFKIDKSKSVVIPKNSRLSPKRWVWSLVDPHGRSHREYLKSVTPTDDIVSYRQHTSFVALPENGYQPRKYHSLFRLTLIYLFTIMLLPSIKLLKKYILRHRLVKKHPKKKSEAVEPLVYYVDSGCPEPIKNGFDGWSNGGGMKLRSRGFCQCFSGKGTTSMPTLGCKVQHHPMGSTEEQGAGHTVPRLQIPERGIIKGQV